jgi:hypothetical protein
MTEKLPHCPSPSKRRDKIRKNARVKGNMTNGQLGNGNSFPDHVIKVYDDFFLGKDSNMIVGTIRMVALIVIFSIIGGLLFYSIR